MKNPIETKTEEPEMRTTAVTMSVQLPSALGLINTL